MPLYEYRCRACGDRFEVLQRVGEGSDQVLCPQCGGREVDKQLSTFAAGASGSTAGGFSASSGGGGCGCGSGFS